MHHKHLTKSLRYVLETSKVSTSKNCTILSDLYTHLSFLKQLTIFLQFLSNDPFYESSLLIIDYRICSESLYDLAFVLSVRYAVELVLAQLESCFFATRARHTEANLLQTVHSMYR